MRVKDSQTKRILSRETNVLTKTRNQPKENRTMTNCDTLQKQHEQFERDRKQHERIAIIIEPLPSDTSVEDRLAEFMAEAAYRYAFRVMRE